MRPLHCQQDAEKLVHAFVSSCLGYCDALYTGLPKAAIAELQNIQNAAARVLTKTKMRDHITPVLHNLHWLPVSFRVVLKSCS